MGGILRIQTTFHLALRRTSFVPNTLNKQLNPFFGAHLAKVKAQRSYNTYATIHTEEERSHFILGRYKEIATVPKYHLPVRRPTLDVEGCCAQLRAVGA